MTPDIMVFIAGFLMFVAGMTVVYPPAGLIAGGAVLMAITVFGHERKKVDE